nr:ferric/cupric reductase transmembrane component 2 [Quercus suber]
MAGAAWHGLVSTAPIRANPHALWLVRAGVHCVNRIPRHVSPLALDIPRSSAARSMDRISYAVVSHARIEAEGGRGAGQRSIVRPRRTVARRLCPALHCDLDRLVALWPACPVLFCPQPRPRRQYDLELLKLEPCASFFGGSDPFPLHTDCLRLEGLVPLRITTHTTTSTSWSILSPAPFATKRINCIVLATRRTRACLIAPQPLTPFLVLCWACSSGTAMASRICFLLLLFSKVHHGLALVHGHVHRHVESIAGNRTAISTNAGLAGLVRFMKPRNPMPGPYPDPRGPVTDFGMILNDTAKSSPFSHGLAGVDQAGNWLFANVLVLTFVGFMVITLGYSFLIRTSAHMRLLFTMGCTENQRYWMYNHSSIWPKVKRDLVLAPLGRQRHNKEVQLSSAVSIGTIPSRYHTILLVFYVASNVAYMLVLDWTNETSAAVVADLRGRTGVLAALNLIPTILFAMRNNPLIPILHVSYDTFNLLHRWCARIVVLEAILHTICWAVNAKESGGMQQLGVSLRTSTSYLWGMIATSIFTFIMLTASGPIRHAFYEIFLNAHRVLVAVGIAGVYVHLDKANLPQLPWIKLCLGIWAAELVWRSGRILYHNFSRRRGITQITIEALPAEACRVTFDLARPWAWQPGCHVHAYLPAMALWSSHPFSVAWAEDRQRDSLPLPMEVEMDKLSPLAASPHLTGSDGFSMRSRQPHAPRNTVSSTVAYTPGSSLKPQAPVLTLKRESGVTSISLIMRARTGMTRHIYNKAKASPQGVLTTWGAIEGPYGGHHPMTSYGTVLLFAGGVGITHCVGYIYHLLRQHAAGTSSTQRILLVWSVPNTEALEWVRVWMDQILRMENRRDVLRIQLFVTKPRHRGEVVSNTGSVQMFPGRCNPQTIVEKEMQERIGAMGVTVCGPGAFADSVRAAVRSVMETGNVDFVEEAFTY